MTIAPISIIQARVAERYGVPVAAMRSPRRDNTWVRARHIAMFLTHELVKGATYPIIARAFGKLDHTTAIHAVRKIRWVMRDDAKLARGIDELRAALTAELGGLPADKNPDARAAATQLARVVSNNLYVAADRDPTAFIKRFGPK